MYTLNHVRVLARTLQVRPVVELDEAYWQAGLWPTTEGAAASEPLIVAFARPQLVRSNVEFEISLTGVAASAAGAGAGTGGGAKSAHASSAQHARRHTS